MRVLYSKLCEYAFQNLNGRHSLIGIFDNVRAPQFPVDHPPFFICVEAEFDPMEAGRERVFSFAMIDEDGKQVLGFTGPPSVPQRDPQFGYVKMQITIGVSGVRFEKPGEYRLDVLCDGVKISEERIPVIQVDVPPQEAPPANGV
jgi:hypothetical protein